MAVSMIGPKFYAWDRNGKPLAFGKLYTFQARTNIPKPTYTSEDSTVENPNPLVLNGEGYADVYLNGSYKMLLKDCTGSEIWTSDPVSSFQAEEWINERIATYVSPTKFRIQGNQVESYSLGRVVRVHQSNGFVYGYVVNNYFSDNNTFVELSFSGEEVVDTSLYMVSTHFLTNNSFSSPPEDILFKNIEKLKNGQALSGKSIDFKKNMLLSSIYNEEDVYAITKRIVMTTEDYKLYKDNNDNPDDKADIDIGGGLVAALTRRRIVYATSVGCNRSRQDNSAYLNSALKAAFGGALFLDGEFKFTGTLNIPSNTVIYNGFLKPKNAHANTVHVLNANNVEFNNVKFVGETAGVLKIGDDSKNIRIINSYFGEGLNQNIWLWNCKNIFVNGCTFEKCGYGIITKLNHKSDNITVTNCLSYKQKNDFVEINSGSTTCENLNVSNNIYVGDDDWFEGGTERRFVGITAVDNVSITGNVVENVPGDSAIHLEAHGGNTVISSNVFNNWGDYCCLYLLHSRKNATITGNFIVRSDNRSTNVAINLSSNTYSNEIVVSGNFFIDLSTNAATDKMIAINPSYQTGGLVISNNIFKDTAVAIQGVNCDNSIITGNKITGYAGILLNENVKNEPHSNSSAGVNNMITGNLIKVQNGDLGIHGKTNTKGTQGPKRWMIKDNITNGDIILLNLSRDVTNMNFNVVTGNLLLDGAVATVTPENGQAQKDSQGNFLGYAPPSQQ